MTDNYTVWNLVTILNETRGTLAGAELRNLDLTGINFNDVPLSFNVGTKYINTIFNFSKLSGRQFNSQLHLDKINCITYNKTGTHIYTASEDGSVKQWSVLKGECTNTFISGDSHIFSVSACPNSPKILSTSSNGIITQWCLITGKCIHSFDGIFINKTDRVKKNKPENDIARYFYQIPKAIYSPSGKTIISTSDNGTIHEWNAKDGIFIKSYPGSGSLISSFKFDKDGQKILSSYNDGTIKEWSTKTGEPLQLYPVQKVKVTDVTYSPDFKKFLSFSADSTIKEWDLETGNSNTILELPKDEIPTSITRIDLTGSLCYNRTGDKILVTIKNLFTIEISLISNNEYLIEESNKLLHATYCPNFNRIVFSYSDGSIKEIDYSNRKQTLFIKGGYSEIITKPFYVKNSLLATPNHGTIHEWSSLYGKCLKTFNFKKEISGEIKSTNYNCHENKTLSVLTNGTVLETSNKTGNLIRVLQLEKQTISCASYSKNGKYILTGTKEGHLVEWFDRNNSNYREIIKGSKKIYSAYYSPDQDRIIVGYAKSIEEIFTSTGELIKEYKSKKIEDSRKFYVYSPSGESKNLIRLPQKGANSYIEKSTFSPNGKFILWNDDDTTHIINSKSHRILKSFNNNIFGICQELFRHDDDRILTLNKKIREWSVTENKYRGKNHNISNTAEFILYNPSCNKVLIKYLNYLQEIELASGNILKSFFPQTGLVVHGLDFKNLHPDSVFTEEEKNRLRRYGAIFDDQDELEWNQAVEDAYGDMEEE
ncbi:hypothetical protein GCM10009119_10810 [Algoriphagus jejuensis]|uniref:WD40 repeat protein n=2 Tax=Algoriphagus jejuensis TaxID=419934 RepID=A0ABN1MYC9_9BACT